jgi:hypothetical protein
MQNSSARIKRAIHSSGSGRYVPHSFSILWRHTVCKTADPLRGEGREGKFAARHLHQSQFLGTSNPGFSVASGLQRDETSGARCHGDRDNVVGYAADDKAWCLRTYSGSGAFYSDAVPPVWRECRTVVCRNVHEKIFGRCAVDARGLQNRPVCQQIQGAF